MPECEFRAPSHRVGEPHDDHSVYSGVVSDHRKAMTQLRELDPVTEDLFIGLAELEQFQWFVRAHLQDASGDVTFRDT